MAGTGVPATSILHFNPHVNWRTAKNVAIQCKMPPTVIEADIFQYPEVVVNLATDVITTVLVWFRTILVAVEGR